MEKEIKDFFDLPRQQQVALGKIFKINKRIFLSSEVAKRISRLSGKSTGAILGALYRNGYLKKISGGRDKAWRLSDKASKAEKQLRKHALEVEVYWG